MNEKKYSDFAIPNLDLNSYNLPRFNCANHKINLAIRKAIEEHKILPAYISKLNPFISSNRNCFEQNRSFEHLRCRLR